MVVTSVVPGNRLKKTNMKPEVGVRDFMDS